MRLIDADALFPGKLLVVNLKNPMETAKDLLNRINTAPTIDAAPVVRCKDCIHWYGEEGVCLKIYDDGSVSPYAWQFRNEGDFCSYGEKRDE